MFEPNAASPRGVGQHPHRGFETVTIVYDGEVSHRDSRGGGDVQWMTAAGGIVYEEFHSAGFSKSGGPFHMVQLWVKPPAKDKVRPAGYQSITAERIPTVAIDGGTARIIAGERTARAAPRAPSRRSICGACALGRARTCGSLCRRGIVR